MKILLTICLVVLTLCSTAQTIKMKSTGITGIAGEDIIAFEMSDTANTTVSSGGGGSAGVTKYEVVKIKKLKDSSTTELFKRSVMGTHTADVTFEFYNASNVMTYKISLKDVTVDHFSYLTPECTNCMKLYHQVWFNYAKFEMYDMITGAAFRWSRLTNAAY